MLVKININNGSISYIMNLGELSSGEYLPIQAFDGVNNLYTFTDDGFIIPEIKVVTIKINSGDYTISGTVTPSDNVNGIYFIVWDDNTKSLITLFSIHNPVGFQAARINTQTGAVTVITNIQENKYKLYDGGDYIYNLSTGILYFIGYSSDVGSPPKIYAVNIKTGSVSIVFGGWDPTVGALEFMAMTPLGVVAINVTSTANHICHHSQYLPSYVPINHEYNVTRRKYPISTFPCNSRTNINFYNNLISLDLKTGKTKSIGNKILGNVHWVLSATADSKRYFLISILDEHTNYLETWTLSTGTVSRVIIDGAGNPFGGFFYYKKD